MTAPLIAELEIALMRMTPDSLEHAVDLADQLVATCKTNPDPDLAPAIRRLRRLAQHAVSLVEIAATLRTSDDRLYTADAALEPASPLPVPALTA